MRELTTQLSRLVQRKRANWQTQTLLEASCFKVSDDEAVASLSHLIPCWKWGLKCRWSRSLITWVRLDARISSCSHIFDFHSQLIFTLNDGYMSHLRLMWWVHKHQNTKWGEVALTHRSPDAVLFYFISQLVRDPSRISCKYMVSYRWYVYGDVLSCCVDIRGHTGWLFLYKCIMTGRFNAFVNRSL